MKNIILKTNDVSNIVHRYYFHTHNTRIAKQSAENSVTISPGPPIIQLVRRV
jgi:hypothetical protein